MPTTAKLKSDVAGNGDVVTCERGQVPVRSIKRELVRDVMLTSPKTLPSTATIDEARAFFANPKVVNAVLVDGKTFAGVLHRTDLPSLLPGGVPIRTFAKRDVPTITADRPVTEALEILEAEGLVRLVVVAADRTTLVGLLCLDLKRAGFCKA